jgi:hypothetical protein
MVRAGVDTDELITHGSPHGRIGAIYNPCRSKMGDQIGRFRTENRFQTFVVGITKDCSLDDLVEAVKRALTSPEPGGEGELPKAGRRGIRQIDVHGSPFEFTNATFRHCHASSFSGGLSASSDPALS